MTTGTQDDAVIGGVDVGIDRATESAKQAAVRSRLDDLLATLGDGDALPSERVLAVDLGVARMTLRRVVDAMVADGELRRLHGKGTFVSKNRFISPTGFLSFHDEIASHGMVAATRVTRFAIEDAGVRLGQHLKISPLEPVIRASRVRLADDDPVALERIALRRTRFPDLTAEDLERGSLFELMEKRYGVRVGKATRTIRATVLDQDEADLLGSSVHMPAFNIESVRRDAEDVPLEYLSAILRGDRYRLTSGDDDAAFAPSLHVVGRTREQR